MKELKDYSTRELCEELRKRGGVEIIYPGHNQPILKAIEEAIKEGDLEVTKGPASIFVVID